MYLSIGNMDEAFKAIKAIKESKTIWFNNIINQSKYLSFGTENTNEPHHIGREVARLRQYTEKYF
jgi:hypothetical protein